MSETVTAFFASLGNVLLLYSSSEFLQWRRGRHCSRQLQLKTLVQNLLLPPSPLVMVVLLLFLLLSVSVVLLLFLLRSIIVVLRLVLFLTLVVALLLFHHSFVFFLLFLL